MAEITEAQVLDAIAGIQDPETGGSIATDDRISGLAIRDRMVQVSIEIGAPDKAETFEPVRKQVEEAVARMPNVLNATAVLTAERPHGQGGPQGGGNGAAKTSPGQKAEAAHQRAQGQEAGQGGGAKGIKHIVAVASGKGGVGKSTTAVNLVLALKRLGLKVGILDADVYGPSQPRMLGVSGRPESPDGKTLMPMESYGVKAMSIGFLVAEDQPVVWRGPMVMGALQQMLNDVAWGELDVLIVDMPPGTGDAQLTMAQNVPLSGAVIVSTPQDIALLDARKGLNMFRKVDVPVLGIVENMSTFVCPNCNHETHIFGHGGAEAEAKKLNTPFLGALPLHIDIRETSDSGRPIVETNPESPHAKAYVSIAEKVRDALFGQSAGTARQAPSFVVE